MKCPDCQRSYPGWRNTCPKCQIPLLSLRQKTISETKGEFPGTEKRSSIFPATLRIMALAAVLIGLTTILRLNYASGGRGPGNPATSSPIVPAISPAPDPAVSPEDQGTAETELSVSDEAEGTDERPVSPKPVKPAFVSRLSPAATSDEAKTGPPPPTAISAATGAPASQPDTRNTGIKESAAPGAEAVTVSAEPESGTEINLEPPDHSLSNNIGLVTLNSYTRARIYINGQFSGTTPRTVRLLAGEHTILLLADGYEDWTRKIRLDGRQQMGLMASMIRKSGGSQ